jgi:hypothetical protein
VQLSAGGEFRFTLVDFEGVRRRATVSDGLRARDLGRLAADFVRLPKVHAADMARFLDEYLARDAPLRERRREFAALILRRVREKLDAWKAKGY